MRATEPCHADPKLVCEGRAIQISPERNIAIRLCKFSVPSPRWSSGNPRMLLVLVLKFESCRGEIVDLLGKKEEIG